MKNHKQKYISSWPITDHRPSLVGKRVTFTRRVLILYVRRFTPSLVRRAVEGNLPCGVEQDGFERGPQSTSSRRPGPTLCGGFWPTFESPTRAVIFPSTLMPSWDRLSAAAENVLGHPRQAAHT